VTTSFTFDAALFEEQCLARFLSIQSNPNETAKAYLIEREEKLSQCFACVLVDGAHAAPDRSLRWHMLPVTLPRGGVLHAKLTAAGMGELHSGLDPARPISPNPPTDEIKRSWRLSISERKGIQPPSCLPNV